MQATPLYWKTTTALRDQQPIEGAGHRLPRVLFRDHLKSPTAEALAFWGAIQQCDTGLREILRSIGQSPSRAPNPSAPIVVETTGIPAAIASKIFKRVPPPTRSGTMETFDPHSQGLTSGTVPVT